MAGESGLWTGRRAVTAFGLLTVGFWLSWAVFPKLLPPLVALPDLGGVLDLVPPWMRQSVPGLDRSDGEVLAALHREVLSALATAWLQIAAGVLAGVLIVLRRPAGRWIALVLCGVVLARFIVGQVSLVNDGHLADFWAALTRSAAPSLVRSVLNVVFLAGSAAFLTRRPVALQLARRAPRSAP